MIVANSRWVPPAGFRPPDEPGAWVGLCDGQPACAWSARRTPSRWNRRRRTPGSSGSAAQHPGVGCRRRVDRPPLGPGRAQRRLPRARFRRVGQAGVTNRHLTAMALVGPADRLRSTRPPASIPYTVFDTTNGPIILGPNVWVQPFTRIEGPCSIAADTQLFRANIRGSVTIGPTCRIGGEVEASIVHGYSNKYHEGFLGHAYVGEWVNLGAITSNSDLRNDYGEVQVPAPGRPDPYRARRRSAASSATTRHRHGEHAQHRHVDRRDVQRPAGGHPPAQAHPVVHRGPVRPGRARASRWTSSSRRPAPSWAAAARSSARRSSSST